MQIVFQQSGMAVDLEDEIVQWAKAYETSMLDAYELLNLAAVLTVFPWNTGGFVVELGAYLGTTTVFMAKVLARTNNPVPILSIDPFDRFQPDLLNPQGDYFAYVNNITAAHTEKVCLPLTAFSYDAAPVIANDVGVLVLDGDHHYAVVSQDLKLYMPKVKAGGFIFIDDYGPAYPDVMRAVDEAFAQNTQFKIHAKSYFIIAERIQRPNTRRSISLDRKLRSNKSA